MDIVAYNDVKVVVEKALKQAMPEEDGLSVPALTEAVIDALDGEILVVQREDEVFNEDEEFDEFDDEDGEYDFEEDLT